MNGTYKLNMESLKEMVRFDNDFNSLFYNDAWFNTFVMYLERGMTTEQVVQAVSVLCKSNQEAIKELIEYRHRFGTLQKL